MTIIRLDMSMDRREADRIIAAVSGIRGASVRAAQRAGSKALTRARGRVARHIGQQSALRAVVVKPRIFIKKPSRKKLDGALWVGMVNVDAQKIGLAQRLSKGFRFGSGKNGRTYPSAFSARMPSGHVSVFQRKTSKRLPIEKPSVPLKIDSNFVVRDMGDRYLKLLAQEVNFEIKRSSK